MFFLVLVRDVYLILLKIIRFLNVVCGMFFLRNIFFVILEGNFEKVFVSDK